VKGKVLQDGSPSSEIIENYIDVPLHPYLAGEATWTHGAFPVMGVWIRLGTGAPPHWRTLGGSHERRDPSGDRVAGADRSAHLLPGRGVDVHPEAAHPSGFPGGVAGVGLSLPPARRLHRRL